MIWGALKLFKGTGWISSQDPAADKIVFHEMEKKDQLGMETFEGLCPVMDITGCFKSTLASKKPLLYILFPLKLATAFYFSRYAYML